MSTPKLKQPEDDLTVIRQLSIRRSPESMRCLLIAQGVEECCTVGFGKTVTRSSMKVKAEIASSYSLLFSHGNLLLCMDAVKLIASVPIFETALAANSRLDGRATTVAALLMRT